MKKFAALAALIAALAAAGCGPAPTTDTKLVPTSASVTVSEKKDH